MAPLRVGFVAEHFSTPLHFAKSKFGLDAAYLPFPAGTGAMISAIRAGEIDVGIGLTEGWVAGLGKEGIEGDGGYRIVGTYVQTPLRWAISTGPSRPFESVEDLKGAKIGVSRLGSGSFVMGMVLADSRGWLTEEGGKWKEIVPLENFERLRKGVNDGTADFFMWDHFTSKRYYDNGEIKRIGEIYTPWSSWKIVASTTLSPTDPRLDNLFEKIDKGIEYFEAHQEEAVEYIHTNLDYSEEDARAWLETVKFAKGSGKVDLKVIEKTVETLKKAGVLGNGGMTSRDMIPEHLQK